MSESSANKTKTAGLVALTVILSAVNIFVCYRFIVLKTAAADVFRQMEVDLPLPTQLFIGWPDAVLWGVVIIAAVASAIIVASKESTARRMGIIVAICVGALVLLGAGYFSIQMPIWKLQEYLQDDEEWTEIETPPAAPNLAFNAFRDQLHEELSRIVWKSSIDKLAAGASPKNPKFLHEGHTRIRMDETYLAFFTSKEGQTIDRVEYFVQEDSGPDGKVRSTVWRRLTEDGDLRLEDYAKPHRTPGEYLDPALDTSGDWTQIRMGVSYFEFGYGYAIPGGAPSGEPFILVRHWPSDSDSDPVGGDATPYAIGGYGLSYLTIPPLVSLTYRIRSDPIKGYRQEVLGLPSLWESFLPKATR